jgi:hypothetical protein
MRLVPIAYSAVATILIGGGAVLLPAAPAHASLATLSCQGTQVTAFYPALTRTPTQTYSSSDGAFGSCISTDISIGGAVADAEGVDPAASCDSLLTGGTGQTTFDWNNGNTSVFTYTRTSTDLNGEIVSTETGTITSGEFAGNLATEVIIMPTLDLTACQTSGLPTASGAATFAILPSL